MQLVTTMVKVIDHASTGQMAMMARKTRKLSQADIAKRMGCTPQYISDLERGRSDWNQDRLGRYSKALGKFKPKA